MEKVMSVNNLITNFAVTGTEDVVMSCAMLRQTMIDQGFATKGNVAELKSYTDTIYAMRRAQTAMRTEYRVMNAEIIEGARILRDIGAIGRTVVSMWQAYTLAQTREADAARDVREAQGDIVIIQDALNRSMRAGDLEQQMDLTLKLAHAKTASAEAGQKLAKAQQDNIIGYAGMALQSMDIVARLPMMYMHTMIYIAYLQAKTTTEALDTLATGANTVAQTAKTGAVDVQSLAMARQTGLLGTQASLQAIALGGISADTGARVVDTAAIAAQTGMMGAQATALALQTGLLEVQVAANLGAAASIGVDTGARVANTGVIWGQVAALQAYLALIPGWGWAVLAGAAVVGGAYLASRGGGGGGGATANDNSITIYGGVSVRAENAAGMVDSLRRRGLAE